MNDRVEEPDPGPASAPPPPASAHRSERTLVFLVGAVQFINILDFMMVMPLGPDFAASLGIPTSPARTVEVNEFMATRYPNILACGDVAGPYQFTHTAAHTAWYASVNALFGRFRKFRADFAA